MQLTQLLHAFFCFVKSSRTVLSFSQFCVQPYHSPGAGAERLRGKGPMESRLVRSVGSRGPAGGVMGNVIVPAVWLGWGVKGWGEKPWKKREGRGHLNYLCSLWPLSPSVSLRTDPLSERRCAFPQADAHPPPLFNIAIAPFCEMHKLNCNIFFPLMHFSRFMSLSKKIPFKRKSKLFFPVVCVYVWSQNLARRYQIKDVQQNKAQFSLNWAVLANIFSRLHAAVIVYFGAPALSNTVSDRDRCKINTSQECDVLINSLCCSDRKARHVREGLQRRPLWSCQV